MYTKTVEWRKKKLRIKNRLGRDLNDGKSGDGVRKKPPFCPPTRINGCVRKCGRGGRGELVEGGLVADRQTR
jgi:hypothetical protein